MFLSKWLKRDFSYPKMTIIILLLSENSNFYIPRQFNWNALFILKKEKECVTVVVGFLGEGERQK